MDMFFKVVTFRNKDGSTRQYLHLVEAVRDGKKVRHKVLVTLGRVELLRASGSLDRMANALNRLAEKEKIVDLAKNLSVPSDRVYGPVPVFRRLWKNIGIPKAIAEAVTKETFFAYDAQTAIFRMVAGRLLDPKSKLMTHRWAQTVFWDDGEKVDLQHYYRSLGVLSRCMARIEENLFFQGKNLFTPSPDLLFFDTTSVYFEGEGPVGDLAKYGFSKDKRPDRLQMIVGVVLTKDGTPLAHHVFPGNTPDAAAFSVVIEEMRNRFGIKRVVLVGDRGMFNAKVIARIEELEMEYIAGVRMRSVWDVREIVLENRDPFEMVSENLKVKMVELGGKRYVVCLNEEEARRAKAVRESVVADLKEKLSQGPKGLIGNSAYRKYVTVEKDAVSIDGRKISAEAKYDGKYVLLTNTSLCAKETALAYKELWRVERAFREIKSFLEIRPMYLSREDHVRGHVAMCFLAFCLETAFVKALRGEAEPDDAQKKELRETLSAHSLDSIFTSLKAVRMVEVAIAGKRYRVVSEPDNIATAVFRLLGMPSPRRVTEVDAPPDTQETKPA
ncbi:IS1634 family transposase [Candidatus Poribacteria bacterium]|nr:IS1634 family transposase [Candidatus Poribacteria bacterium]